MVSIIDIYKEATPTTQGYKTICPDCGLQGGRTEGFILFPDNNMAYCHSSGKHFRLLEAYALKKKIIRCLDGRDKDDNKRKVLSGELFTLSLDEFKNEYGTDLYNELIVQLNVRKRIELPGNGILNGNFCDQLGDIYKSRNTLFYRPELRSVVEIERIKLDNDGYIDNGFKIMTSSRFITTAEMLIEPWTTIYTKNGNNMVINRSMSITLANQVLDSKQFQEKLPVISRIFDVQMPIIYQGQLTHPKKGYDPRFKSWMSRNTPEIIDISLEEAISNIENIYKEFPFKTSSDKNKAIAGLLTPFLRGLLKSFSTRTPVFIYMANRERAGKDYCANITGIVYEGQAVEEPPICSGEQKGGESDELRKKITSSMRDGKKRMHFSNNKGLLNNATFESVTTNEVWADRLLGSNNTVKIPNEMDFSLSGNIGLKLTPDMANRSMIINLHLVEENANARKFKNPYLHQWVRENRAMIISSLHSLVKNWFDRGCPAGSVPFASFPNWAEICGGIMEAAGYENPIDNDDTMIPLDSETEDMKIMFQCCHEKYKNEWITKQDIIKIVEEENLMSYIDFNSKSGQTMFGMKVDKFVDRELGGIILRVDDPKRRASRRKYMFFYNLPVLPTTSPDFGKDVETSENLAEKSNKTEIMVEGCQNSGNLVSYRQPFQPYTTAIYNRSCRDIGWMPKVTTLPPPLPVAEVLKKLELEGKTTEVIVKNFQDRLQLKIEQEKKKTVPVKTDRELQFWESPETANITIQCSKEQVLKWIKMNPKGKYQDMRRSCGLGCVKQIGELLKDGLIVGSADDGWEVKDGMV